MTLLVLLPVGKSRLADGTYQVSAAEVARKILDNMQQPNRKRPVVTPAYFSTQEIVERTSIQIDALTRDIWSSKSIRSDTFYAGVARQLEGHHPMSDKLYLIRFKASELICHAVIAARAEIHGEHLVFLRSEGRLAALFLMEIIENWSEFEL
jgi:hypothetical protein